MRHPMQRWPSPAVPLCRRCRGQNLRRLRISQVKAITYHVNYEGTRRSVTITVELAFWVTHALSIAP
jgi:hypothetical protein